MDCQFSNNSAKLSQVRLDPLRVSKKRCNIFKWNLPRAKRYFPHENNNRIKYSLSPAASEYTRTWPKWQVQYIGRKHVRKILCRVIFCQSVHKLFLSFLIFLDVYFCFPYLTGEIIKPIFLSITLTESNVKYLRRDWLFTGGRVLLLIASLFALFVLFILVVLVTWFALNLA